MAGSDRSYWGFVDSSLPSQTRRCVLRALQAGTLWTPYDTLALSLSDAHGTISRVSGEWSVALEAGIDLWFRADIATLSLPVLGALSNLSVVASSIDLPDFDAFGTAGLASDDLSNGKTCYVDGMCTSDRCDHFQMGLCEQGVCACNDDDDCESYEHCDSGDCLDDTTVHGSCNEDSDCVLGNCACPLTGGNCHSIAGIRVIGADCYDDDECASGRCGSSTHSNCNLATCECADDGDCLTSEHCETGTCEDDHEDHDNCDEDSDCESGICDCGLIFGKCVRHDNSRDVGATCYVNSECESGSCSTVSCDISGSLGVCKCNVQGDCDVEDYCNSDTLDHPFEDPDLRHRGHGVVAIGGRRVRARLARLGPDLELPRDRVLRRQAMPRSLCRSRPVPRTTPSWMRSSVRPVHSR